MNITMWWESILSKAVDLFHQELSLISLVVFQGETSPKDYKRDQPCQSQFVDNESWQFPSQNCQSQLTIGIYVFRKSALLARSPLSWALPWLHLTCVTDSTGLSLQFPLSTHRVVDFQLS